MKIRTRWAITRVEEQIQEADFHKTEEVVRRKRINEDENHFRTCRLCLKKINKNFEKLISVVETTNWSHYDYHEACYKEATEGL